MEKISLRIKYDNLKRRYVWLEDELDDKNNLVNVWAFVAILFGILFMIQMVAYDDNVDIDDNLAPYLCKQHNATLSNVEYTTSGGFNIMLKTLKITCQRERAKPVDDGYLFIMD